ncbi:MAG: TonB-dependent receptor [Bacteroidota bacterium]|nr:TonB-dependent receptor [Bacteroidota bacterium]
MKKSLVMLSALCFTYAKAQNITVRDNTSRDVLQNIVVKDKNSKTATTNNNGVVNISELDKSDSLQLLNVSYYAKKFMASSKDTSLSLFAKQIQLDEVVFSANRKEESMMDVPYSINIIKQKEIEFGNQPTSADLLQNTGQVFVQKSQLGGGSAIIRGFEANKVLIVVDGVRMNNAIYRGGHLQDLITLDPNMLERTEVIFGPSSTIYGSDALGGVMHFYSKQAQFSSNDKLLLKGNGVLRYSSATKEQTGHLDLNIGTKKFASMTNITFSDFSDLKTGTTKLAGQPNSWDCNYYVEKYTNVNGVQRDTMLKSTNNNIMARSGYAQFDLMQRFAVKTGEYTTHGLNLQYSQSTNISRYDRLTETGTSTINVVDHIDDAGNSVMVKTNKLKFGDWYYGPQKRFLTSYSLENNKKTAISDNIKLIAAYQKIDQDRISRNFQSNFQTSQREDVSVMSINLDMFKKIKEKHELRYGAEVTANNVKSTAETHNIIVDTVSAAKTRYGDNGNKMNTNGIYLSHSWEVNENFVISDGLRLTANSLESGFKDTTFYKFPYTKASQKNSALTGCIGFTWRERDNYKVSLLANTGFRTPNIDDMSKVFDSNNSILLVPNPDIKPEYATNFELGFSKIIDKHYRFDITTYYTVLENALVQADFIFNGSDSAMFNGSKRKVQAVQNKDRAYIYGVTGGVQFDFNEHVSFKSTVSYVYGRYADIKKDTVVPLDHIPPVFGQTSLQIKQNKLDGEFFVRFNGKKLSADYSSSGEDNAQYSADKIKGYMPAWFTVNVRAGYNITNNLRVNIACENITDNRYRVFASGINAPGRNFIISLRSKF